MGKQLTITTMDGEVFDPRKVATYKVVNTSNEYPHWGWAVFWLLMFWPALIGYFVIGCNRSKVQMLVKFKTGEMPSYWLDSVQHAKLQMVVEV